MRYSIIVVFLFVSSIAAQTVIQSVDFKNFTYRPYCAGDRPFPVRVRNGEFSRETPKNDYVDRFYFRIEDPEYGDLNGDGKDEAAIIGICNTGGTGTFSEGFVYSLRAGKPVLVARFPGGDRAYGGLRSARIEKGLLVVKQNDPGENGAACCPEFVVTKRYKLLGNRLVLRGSVIKREALPAQRVVFDRGSSSKTISVNIPYAEMIGLIVRARKGQRLDVSTDSPLIDTWLQNAAETVERKGGFGAILSEDGDQTIVVDNPTKTDRAVRVTIRID